MYMASNVERVCRRIQSVHLQLKIILEKNVEIQGHLTEVEILANDDSSAAVGNKQHILRQLMKTQDCTQQVKDAVEKQCEILKATVDELERHTEGPDADLHNVPDVKFSEVRIQLKSQLDHNMGLQKEKAELEVKLEEQIRAYKVAGEMTTKLHEDFEAAKKMVMEVVESMDNRTQEAEERLTELQKETDQAHQLAGRYQQLYENESIKSPSKSHYKAVLSPRSPHSSQYNSPVSNHRSPARARLALPRPADIDMRYMNVVDENVLLKNEVKRLRDDNKDLVKKTKMAIKNVDSVQQHIATCSSQKFELQKRLHKEQEQNRRLMANMTKQASEWVSEKKMTRNTENTGKVKHVQMEPGGLIRHKCYPVKINLDKPRDIPVHTW